LEVEAEARTREGEQARGGEEQRGLPSTVIRLEAELLEAQERQAHADRQQLQANQRAQASIAEQRISHIAEAASEERIRHLLGTVASLAATLAIEHAEVDLQPTVVRLIDELERIQATQGSAQEEVARGRAAILELSTALHSEQASLQALQGVVRDCRHQEVVATQARVAQVQECCRLQGLVQRLQWGGAGQGGGAGDGMDMQSEMEILD
jgi:hypothetical protein